MLVSLNYSVHVVFSEVSKEEMPDKKISLVKFIFEQILSSV